MTRDAKRDTQLLRVRAEKLAGRVTHGASRRVWGRVVVAEAGSSRFGFIASGVRTVVPASPVTPLPDLPQFLLGLANVRGDILTVADLAELRGTGRTGSHELFVVVESRRRALAVAVERLVDFRDVFEDELDSGLLGEETEQGFAKTVTRDLVLIVDIEGLIGDRRLRVQQLAAGQPSGSDV